MELKEPGWTEVLTNRNISSPQPLCGPSSAHGNGSGTSERNSNEFYLFVDSIAIITVRLLFLFVMAQQSTRRSTMRREVHEEKCGILYCSRKARFGAVEPWPGDARPAAKIRHRFLQLFNTFVIAHQIRSRSTLEDMQTSLPHARGFHRLTIPSA